MAEANSFQLEGDGIAVDYSSTSLSGRPLLGYQAGTVSRQFIGNDIETTPTPIGTLLTVVLDVIPDLSTTTFSLLLPPVPLPSSGKSEPMQAVGITTVKAMNFSGHPVGAIDAYTTHDLAGSGMSVMS